MGDRSVDGDGFEGSPRSLRRYADSRRPGAASRSAVVAPLVHNRPELAGCEVRPIDLAMWRFPVAESVVTSSTMPQPTPQ
ncbi:assimilatory nitrate reductase large subunit domain protein [Mycobacterium kansasii]|uniref:Assimilatory nitrate reductase large subunit domain protein n=1 Tax=Mycobacterium kansasii TaxID=1768 RepID=A0A1V3WZK2_MYCKA|nr:assimilatory nitrate reductase large subunit domain protein [Mycobacterium kansasii]